MTGRARTPLTGPPSAAVRPPAAQNGPAQNGPTQNGPTQNGPTQNGLAQNSLAQNGLAQNSPALEQGGPVIPAYGSSTLADLLPSIANQLGVPRASGNVLGLPTASRYVVVLVDGLGWELLAAARRHAPYLASRQLLGTPITSGVPSTTATSLASLGTGLPPGRHGIVGYTSRVPGSGEILNALTWESELRAQDYQPHGTVFDLVREAGVAVSSVALRRFRGSGLTEAALRGPEFVPVDDEADVETRLALIKGAAERGTRSLVYAYERELDHRGHVDGCSSPAWRARLSQVDEMCERLREELAPEVRLVVTGDHGMVDVPAEQQVVAEDEPALMAGVDALAGEGRFRQLYVDSDSATAVAERWRDRLGQAAWVRTRDEAIEDGWFGPVTDELRPRYGHVLVAMRGTAAVMTRQFPREFSLVGMHGSLTSAEMRVPLLCD